MKAKKLFTLMTLLVFVSGAQVFYAQPKPVANSPGTFTLTAPGAAFEEPDKLLIAARLNNSSTKTAFKVTIDSAQLESALLVTPTPVSVGDIDASRNVIVQVNFKSGKLSSGKQYPLVISGSYQTTPKSQRKKFTVRSMIVLPPTAPGSAPLSKVTVESYKVKGAPYPHREPKPDLDEVNGPGWTIPTTQFATGKPTVNSTQVKNAFSKGSALFGAAPLFENVKYFPDTVDFLANNSMNLTGAASVAEPSGGSNGNGVVFVSANWLAAFSTDGGNTFTQLDPTTIFPNDAVGFCCDQVVQYVPSIDRFIWLLQGSNGYRLAMASPADIASSGGTAWTSWNLTPNLFGSCTKFDFPDMSVGNNFLYMSWDAMNGFCIPGLQVTRIPLADIQAGGRISFFSTNPTYSACAWFSHISQNTQDEIFWACHNGNNRMWVYSLPEGTEHYSWHNVDVTPWANGGFSSTTPDGINWLENIRQKGTFIGGATRSNNQIWFAWTAGTDNNFRQPHIQMVTLDRNNDFRVIQQVQIWNPDFAFGYPALATNACTNEVGLSFEFGGGGNFENHVVGVWGDFMAFITTASNVSTQRFGDYVTIRQEPRTDANRGNLFSAFGYGLNTVGGGTQSDLHYVLFGRPALRCRN